MRVSSGLKYIIGCLKVLLWHQSFKTGVVTLVKNYTKTSNIFIDISLTTYLLTDIVLIQRFEYFLILCLKCVLIIKTV